MRNVVIVGWPAVPMIMARLVIGGCFVLGPGNVRHVHAQAAEAGDVERGKSQAEQRLTNRLVELANGPPPTMESLAAEFGFVYEKAPSYSEGMQAYLAMASFPFNPAISASFLYMPATTLNAAPDMPARPFPESVYIAFKFVTKPGEASPFCVSRDELDRRLKASWSFYVRAAQPHNLHVEGYTRASGGYDRSASMTPTLPGCITEFRVNYAKASTPVESSTRPTRSTTQGGKK